MVERITSNKKSNEMMRFQVRFLARAFLFLLILISKDRSCISSARKTRTGFQVSDQKPIENRNPPPTQRASFWCRNHASNVRPTYCQRPLDTEKTLSVMLKEVVIRKVRSDNAGRYVGAFINYSTEYSSVRW